jgi:hypothetical protein
MTLEDLVEALRHGVPEVHDLLRDHLAELPGGDEFVLMGLLRVRALELFDAGELEALDRLLALVDQALSDGDEELADAVASDFIAATAPWEPVMDAFVSAWPVHLRAQAAIETARADDT